MTQAQKTAATKAVKKNTAHRASTAGKTIETRRKRQERELDAHLQYITQEAVKYPYGPSAIVSEPVKDFAEELREMKATVRKDMGIKYTWRDLLMVGLGTSVAYLGVWVVYFAFGGK